MLDGKVTFHDRSNSCFFLSLIVLFGSHSLLLAKEDPASIQVVHLGVSRPVKADLKWIPLLPREIFRQAVLMTAREEYGMATRDEVLGEKIPADNPQLLGVGCVTRLVNDEVKIKITPGEQADAFELISDKINISSNGYVPFDSLAGCVELAGAWSRKELVDSFAERGLTQVEKKSDAKAEVADEVFSLPSSFDEYSQFTALRSIHAHVKQHGESRASLQALVKGYAILGQLCRYHFTGREQVFYARALLYADRMMHKYGESPSNYWHRAFARVMVGMDKDAVKDLEKGSELAGEIEVPAWVNVLSNYLENQSVPAIDPSADSDPPTVEAGEEEGEAEESPGIEEKNKGAIAETVEQPQAINWSRIFSQILGDTVPVLPSREAAFEETLAVYLRFVLAERTRNIESVYPCFQELIEVQPYCLRAIDGMADRGQISNLHHTTLLGPERHCLALKTNLAERSDLPAEVVALVNRFDGDRWPSVPLAELSNELRKISNQDIQSELSWEALAQMSEDIQFVHVYRRAMFMKFSWAVPVNGFLDGAIPTLKGHRYQSVLRALKLDKHRQHAAIHSTWDDIEFGDLSATATLLFDKSWWGKYPTSTALRKWAWNRLIQSCDSTSHDLASRVTGIQKSYTAQRLWFARELYEVNSHSPIWAAVCIANDWRATEQHVPSYLEEFGGDTYFLRKLAERQIKEELFEDAQVTLQRYIKVSPNRWGYEQLAAIHRRKGELEQASEAMEKFLSIGSDHGLAEARVQEKLARQYMEQGLLDKAIIKAELAARTGAAWAMLTAGDVRERLGNWSEAEAWYRSTAERYENSETLWYWWCLRTGRGDLAAARSLCQSYFDNLTAELAPGQRVGRGHFRMMKGEFQAAVKDLAIEFAREKNPYTGMHLVLIANEMGDIKTRDKFLEQLPFSWLPALEGSQQRYFEVANLLRQHWNGEPIEFDWEGFEEKLKRSIKVQQVHVLYFASEACDLIGDAERAEKYRRLCAVPLGVSLDYCQSLALAKLHANGIDPYAEELPKLEQAALEGDAKKLYDLAGDLMKQGLSTQARPLLLEYIERTGELSGLRRLARLHLERGEFKEALPFAERAAAWGDATGHLRAMSANDALGNFAASEAWAQKLAEADEDDRAEWFHWCIRTGLGDKEAAQKLAEQYYLKEDPPYRNGDNRPPTYFLLCEELSEAERRFDEAYQADANPWTGLHLAILQHRNGDMKGRNQTLQLVAEPKSIRYRSKKPSTENKLAQLFLPSLEGKKEAPPRIEQVDYILGSLSRISKVDASYFAAQLYNMLDSESEYFTLLKQCVTSSYARKSNQVLAYKELRVRGIDPYSLLLERFAEEN